MKFICFFIVVCLSLQINSSAKERDERNSLQLVHVFFRHGSRTPELVDTYPTDPYRYGTFEHIGWGHLTNTGKQMAFKLGRLLRRRYDSFLGDLYNEDVVKATSTDFDRTKMSALLVLAGLFPPSESQVWNESIPWMPIPYHYDKDKYDYTLRRPNKYCPTYIKELEEVLTSKEAQHYLKSKRKLFQFIAKKTQKPMHKLIDVFHIYQNFNALQNMNLSLPDWAESVFPDEIHAIASKQCELENHNTILKRLNGGRMLSKVIKTMVEKTSNDSAIPLNRKIYLYSGHENNVINILAALNLFEPHVPKFSAAVFVELHYLADSNQYGVKVYYSRDVDVEPQVQKLDGCNVLCPLNDFIRIVEPHVPLNYTAECHSHLNLD